MTLTMAVLVMKMHDAFSNNTNIIEKSNLLHYWKIFILNRFTDVLSILSIFEVFCLSENR